MKIKNVFCFPIQRQAHPNTPAMQPESSVARKAVHKPRIPNMDISLTRDGTRAAIPPTKIPMLAICTKPHSE